MALTTAFFVFGAIMASLACLGLLFPAGPLERMWRLNPEAQVELSRLGGGASC